MSAPTDRLVAEALAKSGLLWLTSEAGSAPCWHVVADGVAYVVTGPGEQYSPAHTGRTSVVARAKESRARLVSFEAEASVVTPEDDDWESATSALKAGRLNAPAGDLVARWREEATILRLVPDLITVVLRGEKLPPPVDTDAGSPDSSSGVPAATQQTPGDRPDDGERPTSGPIRSAQVAAERENRAARRADDEATSESGPASPEAGSGDDGGAAKVTP